MIENSMSSLLNLVYVCVSFLLIAPPLACVGDWPQPSVLCPRCPLVANQFVYLVITPIWTKMSPTTDLLNDPLADNFSGPGQ